MSWRALSSGLLALLAGACVTTVQGTYPGDRVMWDDIVSHAEPLTLPEAPVAVVLPHHLIDAPELAGAWHALAAHQPSVVVVLGPDHHLRGEGVTVGQRVTYETVYGPLPVDEPLARALGGRQLDAAFDGEHAIHVHAPFLRRWLPQARVVPVLVRWATPRAELEALAQRLHATLPADALVVASVDFSHFQPAPWATFHDEASFATLAAVDLDGLFLREVDSPESLFVALRFASLRGAQTATRVWHTNSQARREGLVPDSTSHQYVTFTPGPPRPRPAASLAISPEVPPGSGLTVHEGWTWHPDHDTGAPTSPLLAALRGREDRFFMGPELVLFDLAPGQRVSRTVHGLAVEVVGVDLAAPTPKLEGDCVVAIAARGNLPLAEATRRARELLGLANVVVGRGFGPTLPVEVLDGRVWAPSLGAFPPGTGAAQMLGVTCTPEGVRARTVPLRSTPAGLALDLDALAEALERPRAGP